MYVNLRIDVKDDKLSVYDITARVREIFPGCPVELILQDAPEVKNIFDQNMLPKIITECSQSNVAKDIHVSEATREELVKQVSEGKFQKLSTEGEIQSIRGFNVVTDSTLKDGEWKLVPRA